MKRRAHWVSLLQNAGEHFAAIESKFDQRTVSSNQHREKIYKKKSLCRLDMGITTAELIYKYVGIQVFLLDGRWHSSPSCTGSPSSAAIHWYPYTHLG